MSDETTDMPARPKTLGDWRSIATCLFGDQAKSVKFIDGKIKKSPNGSDERVIADESQFLMALLSIEQG